MHRAKDHSYNRTCSPSAAECTGVVLTLMEVLVNLISCSEHGSTVFIQAMKERSELNAQVILVVHPQACIKDAQNPQCQTDQELVTHRSPL